MKARIGYGLVVSIGMAGLILCTIWCIKGESSVLQWGIAILSMLLMLIGIVCYKEVDDYPNKQEIDEMVLREAHKKHDEEGRER